MKILTEKIKGKHFVVSPNFKKFILGGKKAIRTMIEKNGGTWSYQPMDDRFNYYLLGSQMEDFALSRCYAPLRNGRGKAIAEQELIEFPELENAEFFSDIFERFSALMTRLLSERNIRLDSYKINKPITEKEFASFEKHIKQPIPKAIKEFYSIFGSMQILWKFAYPKASHGISKGRNLWNYSHRDSHPGTIQFLPLRIVLKEKWHDSEMHFSMTEKMKMLDYLSEYHMVALELSDAENPIVKLGTDHGVDFSDYLPMTFSDYVKFTFHTFGSRERPSLFPIPYGRHMSYNKQIERLQKVIERPVKFDFDNMEAQQELKEGIKDRFRTAINENDLAGAEEIANKMCDLGELEYSYLELELAALKNDVEDFEMSLEHYICMHGKRFSFEYYESETSSDRFQDTDFYKEQKSGKSEAWDFYNEKFKDFY